jgi:SAM-dependent methyltransferase
MYLSHRPDIVEPRLPQFLALLSANARILELGCGGGADALYMIAHGFDVDVTDGVAEMAANAATRLGRPVRVMRFDELASVSAYDAVVATACLLHVPIDQLTEILTRIWSALKPGGQFLASYKTGAEHGRDEHDRYYNYLSCNQADDFYRLAGDWASIEYETSQGVGYFSKPAMWLHIVAKKEKLTD